MILLLKRNCPFKMPCRWLNSAFLATKFSRTCCLQITTFMKHGNTLNVTIGEIQKTRCFFKHTTLTIWCYFFCSIQRINNSWNKLSKWQMIYSMWEVVGWKTIQKNETMRFCTLLWEKDAPIFHTGKHISFKHLCAFNWIRASDYINTSTYIPNNL